ncbi:MAG: hypothetical protein Fur005_08040 [Roseiflexaceae bacterium]
MSAHPDHHWFVQMVSHLRHMAGQLSAYLFFPSPLLPRTLLERLIHDIQMQLEYLVSIDPTVEMMQVHTLLIQCLESLEYASTLSLDGAREHAYMVLASAQNALALAIQEAQLLGVF